jgi:hypothetical protein
MQAIKPIRNVFMWSPSPLNFAIDSLVDYDHLSLQEHTPRWKVRWTNKTTLT